jgi:hypothetical protein
MIGVSIPLGVNLFDCCARRFPSGADAPASSRTSRWEDDDVRLRLIRWRR